MKPGEVVPSGREIQFEEHEIIVSKTDLRGIITYANHVFERVSGYSNAELVGTAHNLVRHPEIPRCVFRLLWDGIKAGREVFAYVNNLARNGDNYWVFAHVTPSYDLEGRHIGFHSNRRVPDGDALPKVKALYATLLREERSHGNPQQGLEAGHRKLLELLNREKSNYDRFVFGLSSRTCLESSLS
jgi:PAS domain S-box-containing protein